MGETESVIQIQNVSKVYKLYETPIDRLKEALHPGGKKYHRDFFALHDISFDVKKGETVGIIGKNGSGKSTLLKIITGVLTPSMGKISVSGRISALLELGAGFNPEYTGLENVYLQGTMMGCSHEDMCERVPEILKFADIGEFINQPVKVYSSGMFIRLAFSVAINVDPDILIVDEALAVGDMSFQAKCMTAFKRMQQKGVTVLFVSHDTASVKSLCSRAVWLEAGVIKRVGNAGEIAEDYMRTMREEMNADHEAQKTSEDNNDNNTVGAKANISHKAIMLEKGTAQFKYCGEFDRRVAQFRYGSGGVKITFFEMLDESGNPLSEADFDQMVTLKIYLESYSDVQISVNYYILDEKKNYILGAGLRLVNGKLLSVGKSKRYIVTYKTKLPLQDGVYSIQLQITSPLVIDSTADFVDVIDNAVVFKVNRRHEARVWSKVFIDNELEVKVVE